MIHRNIEKALNLLRVQVHREDAVRAGGDEQVGDELGGDRHARLVFAVLPGVTVERQHRGDARRARPPQSVHHDEQLHQIVVRRRRRRLNDEHVLAADVFLDFDERLAVRERLDRAFAQVHADGSADGPG